MSFTYVRNSNGSGMGPCGTPHVILEGYEQKFSKFTLNNRKPKLLWSVFLTKLPILGILF